MHRLFSALWLLLLIPQVAVAGRTMLTCEQVLQAIELRMSTVDQLRETILNNDVPIERGLRECLVQAEAPSLLIEAAQAREARQGAVDPSRPRIAADVTDPRWPEAVGRDLANWVALWDAWDRGYAILISHRWGRDGWWLQEQQDRIHTAFQGALPALSEPADAKDLLGPSALDLVSDDIELRGAAWRALAHTNLRRVVRLQIDDDGPGVAIATVEVLGEDGSSTRHAVDVLRVQAGTVPGVGDAAVRMRQSLTPTTAIPGGRLAIRAEFVRGKNVEVATPSVVRLYDGVTPIGSMRPQGAEWVAEVDVPASPPPVWSISVLARVEDSESWFSVAVPVLQLKPAPRPTAQANRAAQPRSDEVDLLGELPDDSELRAAPPRPSSVAPIVAKRVQTKTAVDRVWVGVEVHVGASGGLGIGNNTGFDPDTSNNEETTEDDAEAARAAAYVGLFDAPTVHAAMAGVPSLAVDVGGGGAVSVLRWDALLRGHIPVGGTEEVANGSWRPSIALEGFARVAFGWTTRRVGAYVGWRGGFGLLGGSATMSSGPDPGSFPVNGLGLEHGPSLVMDFAVGDSSRSVGDSTRLTVSVDGPAPGTTLGLLTVMAGVAF